MPTKPFHTWTGLDTRSVQDSADPRTLRVATNVDLLTDGSIQERDGWKLVATVDADSVGLYSVGGRLRAAMAAGHSKPAATQSSVPILYDFVGDGTVYTVNSLSRVSSVSSWDADSAIGLYPAIIIQRTTGTYELHWIVDVPSPSVNGSPPPAYVPSNDPVNTKVLTPFTVGESLLKIQEKVCVVDNTNGAIRFNSTVNGITDFTTPGDAGYLPVIRHATGDRTIRGVSFYDEFMAVMFEDSMQLWSMHPDPAQMSLRRVLAGPGTQFPGSVVNVRGDLVYFSRGTFSSLRRAEQNGQLTDGDIGAPISPETKPLANTRPTALWSQARSAYYCFFGSVGYRYVVSPTSETRGWTKYVLPAGLTADYAVEHLGEIYIRSGANVYRMEEGYADGSTYEVASHFLDLGHSGEWKMFNSLDFTGGGTPVINFHYDMRNPTAFDRLCRLDGSTASMAYVSVLENSEAGSLAFTGSVGSDFYIDKFVVRYSIAGKFAI